MHKSPAKTQPARPLQNSTMRASIQQSWLFQRWNDLKQNVLQSLSQLNLHRPIDLLLHIPNGYQERPLTEHFPTHVPHVTLHISFVGIRYKGNMCIIDCTTRMGMLLQVIFFQKVPWIINMMRQNKQCFVSGSLEFYKGKAQMNHPEYVCASIDDIPHPEPIYKKTKGLYNHTLLRLVRVQLDKCHQDRYSDPACRLLFEHRWQSNELPTWMDSLKTLHCPDPLNYKDKVTAARYRLLHDELFLRHHYMNERPSGSHIQPITTSLPDLHKLIERNLSITLTGEQVNLSQAIAKDIADPHKLMLRLLQGDVGSGKTVIALIAMLQVALQGYQACIMAPSTILAQQHHEIISNLLKDQGHDIEAVLITGKNKKALERVKQGDALIVTGTHSLFQDAIAFHNLYLCVIDEQQKFGVAQRLILQSKKEMGCHLLMLSATPIPRTLAMAIYGGIDISSLRSMLPNRHKPMTLIVSHTRMEEVYKFLQHKLDQPYKPQVFWVCPRIEDDEVSKVPSVTLRMAELCKIFPKSKLGLLHGQLKEDEKMKLITAFREGLISILVSTQIIEVGIDIPKASIMILEGAETFGLSQLHQLRGRICRGSEQGICILMYKQLTELVRQRLEAMKQTSDGFEIAKIDLDLRGEGEVHGLRQSGLSMRFGTVDDLHIVCPLVQQSLSDEGHCLHVQSLIFLLELILAADISGH